MKKLIYFLFAIFVLFEVVPLVSSLDQSFEIQYDWYIANNTYSYEKTIEFSSFLMKVSTVNESICKYSLTPNLTYSNYEEVFDETGGKIHSKIFTNLSDGYYRYYIKCKSAFSSSEPKEIAALLRINSFVTGQIKLNKDAPLTEGEIEIRLTTTKYISQTPILSYSLDGINYNPVVLTGSGKIWRGTIILEKDSGEGVLSFKLRATDLENRLGTEITSGSYFSFDTIEPKLITDIKANNEENKVYLSWHLNEKVDEYKIYKSEFPNVDYTDYYKTVDGTTYSDTAVSNGKTYYYRIAAVDEAGNEGDLSKEVSAMGLTSNSVVSNGLNSQLVGTVDSFISEIDLLLSDVGEISSTFDSKSNSEKEFLSVFGLTEKLNKAKIDLENLKKTSQGYKLQDLTKTDLETKINSLKSKLNVIKKDIPKDLVIVDQSKRTETFSSEKLLRAISKVNNLISDSDKDNSLKETEKILKENKLNVESFFYDVKITYFDDSYKEYSLVKRNVLSEFEAISDSYFVENFPSSVISDISELNIKTRSYDVLNEENSLSFSTDTKEIIYYLPKNSNFKNLEDIEFSFVKIISKGDTSSSITGFAIFESSNGGFLWAFVIGIFTLFLFYVVYSKSNNFSDEYFRLFNKLNEGLEYLDKKKVSESREIYNYVKLNYLKLKSNEKRELYAKIDLLYNNILISEMQDGLIQLDKTKDKNLLKTLEKKLFSLSKENQEKILPFFNKIKGDIENEN